MSPWDLPLWAFVIGLSAFIASWGVAFAVVLVVGAATLPLLTRTTSTKEDIL